MYQRSVCPNNEVMGCFTHHRGLSHLHLLFDILKLQEWFKGILSLWKRKAFHYKCRVANVSFFNRVNTNLDVDLHCFLNSFKCLMSLRGLPYALHMPSNPKKVILCSFCAACLNTTCTVSARCHFLGSSHAGRFFLKALWSEQESSDWAGKSWWFRIIS